MENPIQRYLTDAIAAEKSFETQLKGFAEEATYPNAKDAFSTHAVETRQQYEDLTARLKALGGEPSTMKSAMAHLFNMAPKAAQIGHADEERTTQDLIIAYSVENAEVAMYESMVIAAEAVGDSLTVSLAKRIQAQEKETAAKVWKLIAPTATNAYRKVTSSDGTTRTEVIVRYLVDAEAAERNFEDALASFSKTGDQPEVQSLLSSLSSKAKTQHDRLETRLRALGGSPSTAKSILARMLTFTPVSAQMGHAASEKNTQHLMITFAAASAEMAMYECLAAAAEAAGDQQTLQLARELQAEEKEDYALAWEQLGRSARKATSQVMQQSGS
jgi:ferritin-like metal-binding protein YciE